MPYTKRREYDHTQARITYTYNIYICANKIHSSSHRELYAQLKKDTVWSHRARSQFPHVSSNTNTQPWEQTCQPTKKNSESERKQSIYRKRETAGMRERKYIKSLIPQEHHGCKQTVCWGCADSQSVMRYGQVTHHWPTQTTYTGVGPTSLPRASHSLFTSLYLLKCITFSKQN